METQASVNQWANETFGPCSVTTAINRMFEEIAELDAANENWTTTNYAVNMKGECADVVITMFRVAEMLGFDLQKAIDSKMAINRERKWRVSPEGIGYHV